MVAGLAFVRGHRHARLEDRLLAGASFLLAGAVFQYLAMPVVATDWVTPRDGLRLAAYLLVVASAFTRYMRTRDDQARAALTSERERIARDLHDGLAQDLACIATQSQRLGVRLGPNHPLLLATRHALAASRGAITDLWASAAPSTEAALRLIADDLEHRYNLQVRVRVEPENGLSGERDLEPLTREHVIRIAREAIVNAAVHGMARRVDVVLQRRERDLLLRVSDDGRGIGDSGHNGFGLRTMHARAAALGGSLTAHRRVDGGTELELRFHDRARRGAIVRSKEIKVLVVDDHELFRAGIVGLLEERGIEFWATPQTAPTESGSRAGTRRCPDGPEHARDVRHRGNAAADRCTAGACPRADGVGRRPLRHGRTLGGCVRILAQGRSDRSHRRWDRGRRARRVDDLATNREPARPRHILERSNPGFREQNSRRANMKSSS